MDGDCEKIKIKRKTVLSLFDHSTNMVRPWANAGYRCICVDTQHDGRETQSVEGGGEIITVGTDIRAYLPPRTEYEIVFAFPPCTNLAVSGARWFKQKGLTGLADAIELVEQARKTCEWADAPWMIENPVSTLSTYWQEPDYTFHPYQYAGYTDQDEAYSKKTCLWTSDDFVMPPTDAVEEYDDRIHKMPPSEDRNRNRSETPMGFAHAVFQANAEDRVVPLAYGE
ncbi:hypothetical protein SAMN05444422_101468 [Halobiforma haloterrestris]|uniref:DNA (Cytosine-5)-methyltransferase 1 n=1 Tax=Natronobacterium haloterrestre TaxID=148448 RepID=A0A1I1DGE6_NATHA|nr:hypothetical protein [Halobiforma haloterrestris]SFB72128.1 hypothetical protein SAMN05444422_101468 [Halobiforma haloterrestris]